MSEVDVKETVDNEEVEKAPAEELVDMILAGELHAANEKFNSIVEAKVIEKIEEEKHKISQTLFAEDDDEEEEGDDKKKKDDDDDDEEDEDDSPVGKADEGKIPPQFLKKGDDDSDDEEDDDDDKEDDDDEKEDTKEGITGDPEANEKAIAKNRAMAKKYGQVRQGIPPEKKTEELEPVDEISSALASRAGEKAMGKIKSVSGSSPELGTSKSAQADAKRKRQSDKFDAYANRKDDPKKGQTAAQAAGKAGRKSDQQRHTDWQEGITGDPEANEKALAKNRAMAKKYGQVRQGIPPEKKEEVEPEQSFDPGEASANVELPKDSFVSQVALHLSGKRH